MHPRVPGDLGPGRRAERRPLRVQPAGQGPLPDWESIAVHRAAALRAAADLGDHAAAALAFELSLTAGAAFNDRYDTAAALPPAIGVERWADHVLAFETLYLPGEGEHRLVTNFGQH
nr:hypothetical protein [Lentzea atacamensis]